jgi:hypothetical protein
VGGELRIRRRDREITARVLRAPAKRNVSRREADQLVEIVSERILEPLND